MALAYHKEIDRQTSFALWKIEEQADELVAQLQLKEHELLYLDTLINGKRNIHWLSTRVLLRSMLNTNSYIDCKVDEHGKPYLVNFPHFISLSHSFDYAAVMISQDRPVGIDIEQINDKIGRIAKKFMNKEEMAFMDPEHQTEHLYIAWCAKEAVYKLQGKKNVSFLNNIRLHKFDYKPEGSFDASLELEDSRKDFQVHFQQMDDYMIGYVADDEYAK